jgi:hypothetical protein
VRGRTLIALVLVALAALPVAAWASRPPSGSRWVGRTSQGYKIVLRVTADGRAATIDFTHHEPCSDGRRYVVPVAFHSQRPSLRPDGTFSFIEHDRNVAPPAGMPYRFDEDQHITGTFAGRKVHGAYTDSTRFQGGPVCRVKHMTYTATRR